MRGLILALALAAAAPAVAQPPAAAQPPRSPRAAAPLDLTGQWVAIVNEDWRFRMLTPKKGDYPGLPLNAAGRAAADAWDPATDGSCKAYGVGGVMRMPGRLRIGWESDTVLKIETDAGVQTRRLVFGPPPPTPAARSLQGYSAAQWENAHVQPAVVAGGVTVQDDRPLPGGDLKAITTNHTDGWLRRNGVPYSDRAVVTEYFDRWPSPDGKQWMSVTTVIDDPQYLAGPLITSTHFRKEPDQSKWYPKPCKG